MRSKLSEILRLCGITNQHRQPHVHGRTPPKGWEVRAVYSHGEPVEIIFTRKPEVIREVDEFPI